MKKILTIIKNIFSKKSVRFLMGVIFILAIAGGILRFTPLGEKVPVPSSVKNMLGMQSPEEKAQEEVKIIVKKIRKLMDLPKDDEPVLATVQDIDLLVKEQKFFEGAENGDVVLIFPKAAKAILYSPKRNVIVNAGPVSSGSGGTTSSAVKQATSPLTVEIRNGTDKNGLANTIKDQLSTSALFQVTGTADAKQKNYESTILVDTGKAVNRDAVGQLAEVLGAKTVNSLPSGEKETNADIVIILGENIANN